MQTSSLSTVERADLSPKTPRVVVMGAGHLSALYAEHLEASGCRVTRIDINSQASQEAEISDPVDMAVVAVGEPQASLRALVDAVCRLTSVMASNGVVEELPGSPPSYESLAPAQPVQQEQVDPWP